MQRKLLDILLGLFCLVGVTVFALTWIINEQKQKPADTTNPITASPSTLPMPVQALISCYPQWVVGYANDSLILSDSTRMLYDDGRPKTTLELLDNADIEDIFAFDYTQGESIPQYGQDAGRSRCDAFFKKMYGNTQTAVAKNLTTVDWFGSKIKITKINDVNLHLQAVASDISKHPELIDYVSCSGTFYWRPVRGSNRLSAHSYGIAIDIAVKYADYWLWDQPKATELDSLNYRNRIPLKLVQIFENHGFIWGGRWYHYDTMHFEYRPEILHYSRS